MIKKLFRTILFLFLFVGSVYADSAKQVDFLLTGYRTPTTDVVLSGGKVYTYLDGTSTLSALWTDKDKGGSATNPVILDSTGKAEIYGDNIYKFEIYDSNDVLIETITGLEYFTSDNSLSTGLDVDHNTDFTHIVYESTAALRASTLTPFDNQKISITGTDSQGDNGGRDYYWASSSTETDDDWSIIKVTSITTGRWKLPKILSIMVDDFGPLGNVAGDSTTIQACFDYVNTLDNELPVQITFPGYGEICYINATITSGKDNITVYAHGTSFYPMSDITMFDMNENAVIDDSVDIVRSGFWLGGFFDHGEGGTSTGTALKWNNSRGITITDVRFRGIKHCIEAAFLDSFRITNIYARNVIKGFYYPEFHTLPALVGQDIWLRNWLFSSSSSYTTTCFDFTSGGADILIDGFSINLTNGSMFYARTDLLPLINIRMRNGSTEQGTGTYIKIDANATTDNASGLVVDGVTFGSGAIVMDIDRIEGLVNIINNDFVSTLQTAIQITSLRERAILNVDKNQFRQTLSGGGVCWDVTFSGTNSRMYVGDNLYNDSDRGDRTVSSSSSVTYKADKWETLASAATITILPDTGYVQLTGTTTITDIVDTWRGHEVILYFLGVITVNDNANLQLNGNLSAITDTTLTLVNTGSKWVEISRSIN